jgi:GntR family transcriptional regulator
MTETSFLFSQKQRESLSKDSPTPLYYQLYKLLNSCILDGSFENGMRMPTEKQLSREFDISRITAKRTLDELAAEGLVERHRGKGTHVIYQYKPEPVHAPLIGVLQEIESIARHSRAIILDCAMLQPPKDIREELGLQAGETALYLKRVRESNSLRFAYYVSWTRGVKKPRNPKVLETTPRLAYFRQNGLELTHVKQIFSAAAASDEAAEALGVKPGSPLLSLKRRSFNDASGDEQMMDYLQVYYHPDRFQYRMDLRLDEGSSDNSKILGSPKKDVARKAKKVASKKRKA